MARSQLEALSSFSRHAKLSNEERLALAEDVASLLGSEFRAIKVTYGDLGLVGVEHEPSSLGFLLIPGGEIDIGLGDADLDAIDAFVQADDAEGQELLQRLLRTCRPVHRVAIPPFLCGDMPLLHGEATDLLETFEDREHPFWGSGESSADVPADLTAREAARACDLAGFRTLSEAEFEYVAREGGRVHWINEADEAWRALFQKSPSQHGMPEENGWGILGLHLGEWVADGWHPSYEAAPSTRAPWDPKGTPTMFRASGKRAFPWQNRAEILYCHPAYRGVAAPRDRYALRFALDLPSPGESTRRA